MPMTGPLALSRSETDTRLAFARLTDAATDAVESAYVDAIAAIRIAGATIIVVDPARDDLCFQDASGIMAAGDGDAVRRINDAAGSGSYVLAPSDAARPTRNLTSGVWGLDVAGASQLRGFTVAGDNLEVGTVWAHVGAWANTVVAGRAFGTTSDFLDALSTAAGPVWTWRNTANSAYATVVTGDPSAMHVLTVEQIAATSLDVRYNGAGDTTTGIMDAGAQAQHLAIFTSRSQDLNSPMTGRLVAGVWCTGSITSTQRAAIEARIAAAAGVSL